MTTTDLTVYRSTDPRALDIWRASLQDHEQMRRRVSDFLAEVSPDRPDRNMLIKGRRFMGMQHRDGWTVPQGWRVDKDGHAVPDMRTKTGKAAAEKLAAISPLDVRSALSMNAGMPSMAIRADHARFLEPGVALHGGALYVTWGGELDPADASHIDTAIWERVPLSRYYAAVEAAATTSDEVAA